MNDRAPTRVGAMVSAVVAVLVTTAVPAGAEPVRVRHQEGLVHGFLVLQAADGRTLAHGDLTQLVDGDRVTAHMVFRFVDGSISDETVVFSERREFRLISDRLEQKGPSFPTPLTMSVDAASGDVTVEYAEKGKQKKAHKHFDLPADLANGLIPVLLKNVDPDAPPKSVSMVVATPEPRLLTLEFAAVTTVRLSIGGERRSASRFVLHPDIGGIAGLFAPLVGKQPPDAEVWILRSDAPAFLAAFQQMYRDGPVWHIALDAPDWRPAGEGDGPRQPPAR
jgi:hypothetical protein